MARRPWITKWHFTYGEHEWDKIIMSDYLPVTIYADTTGQYSEEEIEKMQDEFWGQMIDIPVPENLLKKWWYECLEFDREWGVGWMPEDGWPEVSDDDFRHWLHAESTADDTNSLYDWLVAHNYTWKRID